MSPLIFQYLFALIIQIDIALLNPLNLVHQKLIIHHCKSDFSFSHQEIHLLILCLVYNQNLRQIIQFCQSVLVPNLYLEMLIFRYLTTNLWVVVV